MRLEGDSSARHKAISTMPLWWDSMPQGIRNNIAFRVDHWARERGYDPASSITLRRRLDMLLIHLRKPAAGFTRLFPAARLTV